MTYLRLLRLTFIAASLMALAQPLGALAAPGTPPAPKTPIKHFIVMMQEGHSFDNYFGTYPGADGFPAHTCVPVDVTAPQNAPCVQPFRLGELPVEHLAHGAGTYETQFNDGKMDGFIYALRQHGQNGALSMGYYDATDLPYYWNLADDYVLFDRFFSSAADGSLPNRMFWLTGTAGNTTGQIPANGFGDLPTIFDVLNRQGITWKFYVQNYNQRLTYRTVKDGGAAAQVNRVPLLAYDRFIDDPNLSSHIVDLDQYYEDLYNGTLPAVAYVAAASASEHAPANIQAGQRLVRAMINALMQSEAWNSSAFLLTYDSWGGWYDHVAPPKVDNDGYGFRVPALLISAYARKGYIDSTELDVSSALKFIEDNYQLPPLATRVGQAKSLAGAFDFTRPPRRPHMITATRETTQVVEPRRDIVYAGYSSMIVLAGIVMVVAIALAGGNHRQKKLGQQHISQEGAS
jgi:phospholipase C